MARSTTPTSIYRKLLHQGLMRSLRHKPLWVFGFGASFIATGGIVEVLFRTYQHIERGPRFFESLLSGQFVGYDLFGQTIIQIQGQPHATWGLLAVIGGIGLLLAIVGLLSRAALIGGLFDRSPKSLWSTIKRAIPYFWRTLGMTLIQKLTIAICLLATVLPLVLISRTGEHVWMGLLTFLIFFPLVIIVHVVTSLGLIDVIKKDHDLSTALHKGLMLLKTHWLVVIELGVILFFVAALAGLVGMTIGMLLVVPYLILVVFAVLSSSPFILVLVNTIGFGLLAVIMATIAGFTVCFQHAVWVEFYKRATHGSLVRALRSKLDRFISAILPK